MKDICQSVMTSLLLSPAAPALLAVERKTILFFAFGQGLKNGLGRVGRRRRRRKNNGGHSPPHLLSGEGEGRGRTSKEDDGRRGTDRSNPSRVYVRCGQKNAFPGNAAVG